MVSGTVLWNMNRMDIIRPILRAWIFFRPLLVRMGNQTPGRTKTDSKRLQDVTVRNEVDIAARQAVESEEENSLETKVQINVSISGVSDPGYYCVRVSATGAECEFDVIGTTEVALVESECVFVKTVVSDYAFEAPQKLRFEIVHLPSGTRLDDPVPISPSTPLPHGVRIVDMIECSLADVISTPTSHLTLTLKSAASLTVFAEEIKLLQNVVTFDAVVTNYKPSPEAKKAKEYEVFISFHRPAEGVVDSTLQPRFIKTEVNTYKAHASNPTYRWSGLQASVNAMCRGFVHLPILLNIWEVVGTHVGLVGTGSVTYDRLAASVGVSSVNIECDHGITIEISSVKITRGFSFLDYIASGLEISLLIGIDFTKSNKDANLPDSLHHLDAAGYPSNDYVQAIKSVVQILDHYDSDHKFPVYGFGSRLPPSYTHCSHLFACNGDFFKPEVVGVQGVLDAYTAALKSVLLHGPTNLHEIIALMTQVAEIAIQGTNTLRYYLLLILTDGVISDMRATIDEIVRASELPISIVVIGVGDEDFSLMKILDGDENRLKSSSLGREAKRDIVQFVPFNEYRGAPLYKLAMETLDEIPREIVNFFDSKGIRPQPRKSASRQPEPVESADESPFLRYLAKVKQDFIEDVMKNDPSIKRETIDKIIDQNKIPSANVEYFADVMSNGPTYGNVFDQNRLNKTPISEITHQPSRGSQKTPDSTRHVELCRWCKDRPVNTVLIPCGHALFCLKCTDHVGAVCPACSHPVTRIIPKLPSL